ncbi:hypothetical protein SY89_02037 [Halolamina pelagica]|uniref:DUF4157 domain-containing protein n=1 Tax=Halolamina pelagica TaxID=699431 RepID=A0A0P7FW21_9EURY|nr:hypothetical protein [Halolamina pelagica]KPN31294.1 hypothetical protein SY89_02037 [Halolamina pelagica]
MRRAVLACTLLVLAGCGGAIAPGPTPTEPAATGVAVDGDLPVEPTPVFLRVLNLTGERAEAPAVTVESAPRASAPDLPQFPVALGITPHNESDPTGPHVRTHAATAIDGESVTVYEWALDAPELTETTLAHEFVHVVQFRHGWDEAALRRQARVGGGLSYDGATTYALLREGAATYAQTAYERRFLPDRRSSMAHQEAAYENASAYARLLLARYHFGAEYVAERVDSPAGLETLHRDPPTSTEQVLHDSQDPVANLTLKTEETGSWVERDRDRQGELFLRIALRTELNRSSAVGAAHGWGNDRRVTFVREDEVATAWVLRWDDAANASEFAVAFTEYLDAKATAEDGLWRGDDVNATYRVERVGDETVVVYLGDESFVRSATATASGDGDVTIEAGDGAA